MKRVSKECVKLIDDEGIKRGLKGWKHNREIMWGGSSCLFDLVVCTAVHYWKDWGLPA